METERKGEGDYETGMHVNKNKQRKQLNKEGARMTLM